MKLYPNPYHHLDHKGRLAGACPMEPTHRAGTRAYVCAEMLCVNKAELDDDKSLKDDPDARGMREHHGFTFSVEPMNISADPGWYYMQRARSGEVFAPRDGKPPMALWAFARAKAAAEWSAQHGESPDFAVWAEQWPLDAQIAEFARDATSRAKAPAEWATKGTPSEKGSAK